MIKCGPQNGSPYAHELKTHIRITLAIAKSEFQFDSRIMIGQKGTYRLALVVLCFGWSKCTAFRFALKLRLYKIFELFQIDYNVSREQTFTLTFFSSYNHCVGLL